MIHGRPVGAQFALVFLSLALLCTGCGRSPIMITPKLAEPRAELSANLQSDSLRPLVRIRYPVGIKEGDETQVLQAWKLSQRSTSYEGYKHYFDTVPLATLRSSMDQLFTKTQYFVMEFYLNLASTMPRGAVVLEPVLLKMDDDGIVRGEGPVEPIPTPVVVHFGVDCELLPLVMGEVFDFDTFGTDLSPDIAVEGIDLATGTRNFLASHWAFHLSNGSVEGLSALTRINLRDQNREDWADLPRVPNLQAASARPARMGQFQLFANRLKCMAWFSITDQQLGNYSGDARKSPFAPLWDYYGNYVREYLNDSQTGQSTSAQQSAYLNLLGAGSRSAKVMEFAQQCISIEAEAMNQQDVDYANRMYSGEFGNSLRDSLLAEAQRSSAQVAAYNQMGNQALLSSSMMLYGTAAAANGRIAPAENMALQTSAITMNFAAMQQNQQLQNGLAAQFRSHLGRVYEAQREYLLKSAAGDHRIRARSLQDLRKQLAEIYVSDIGRQG